MDIVISVLVVVGVALLVLVITSMRWIEIQAMVEVQRSLWRGYSKRQRRFTVMLFVVCAVVLVGILILDPLRNVTVPPR
jgi:hypothetical protein